MTRLAAFLLPLALFATHVPAQDVEGSSDHPQIGRYEGSTITRYDRADYDAQRLYVDASDPKEGFEEFEGEVTRIRYRLPEGASMLQVRRSFEQALAEAGFDVLVNCGGDDCGRFNVTQLRQTVPGYILGNQREILTVAKTSDQGTTRAQITVTPKDVLVNVVDQAEFENRVIDAAEVQSTLEAEGRMAFYDIHFETGSATLDADSQPTIALIAEVLGADPDLAIFVVGHTDNEGSFDYNLDLSKARAEAVAAALVSDHGIAATRVNAAGVAFLAPVSTNTTADGRALNRRVEIVAR